MNRFLRKAAGLFTAVTMAVGMVTVPAAAADSRQKLPENEAMTFVDSMGAGWNLGNAFDAWAPTTPSNELNLETTWCGAKTTKELIKTVKDAGFNTIRIPVSWHNHVDKDYNISSVWMDRVKEVVDWCLDEGLYVIINIHHDNDKNNYAYYRPSKSEQTQSVKYIKKIWTQVAAAFKNYGEKLIFQGMNEPRLTGSANYEWWYDKNNVPAEVKEALELINLYNQTFVDTVRASGGNNAKRYLLIVGYAAKNDELGILSPYFKMPTDTVKNRLIADAHYYGIGVKSSPAVIDGLYKAYTSKGIPVVISEYGLNENGYAYSDKTDIAVQRMGDFYSYARNRGVSVIVWDNNYGGKGISPSHKFIDRKTAKVITPEIVSAITKAGAPALSSSSSSSGTSSSGTSTTSTTSSKYTGTTSAGAAFKVTAKSTVANKATLTWSKVSGATRYAVYQYKDGKYKLLSSKLTKTSVTIGGLKSGTEYKFLVRAYVNGKWTAATTKEIVKITAR